MKNVTIALDDETHRKARIRAAELGTSLSALVKRYLESLAASDEAADPAGVREMPMSYAAPPQQVADAQQTGNGGPPWFVNGRWVYTKDGKPRQPGALRGRIDLSDDWDEWPEGFIDAMYGEDTDAAKNWYKKAR